MALELNIPSPLEDFKHPLLEEFNITVKVKRDDLIHPEISGNKWRKLKLNIEKCKHGLYDGLLTFGGAYSNHISATAAAGKALGIKTIGIIRGEELSANSNETLSRAAENGMELVFVSREEYSWRYETDYKHSLRTRFGNVLVIEEGGANFHGVMGCTEIVAEINEEPDFYMLAVGTGTTASGILLASENTPVIGVPVFKNGGFIREEIKNLLYYAGLGDEELDEKMELLDLATDYHFGGYGKFTDELITFINEVYRTAGLKLDQIYTGKMVYALFDRIKSGKIPTGSTVIIIHTGGLQGTNSIREQLDF